MKILFLTLLLAGALKGNTNNAVIYVVACSTCVTWGGYGIPGYTQDCALVTNAQIRYMQQNFSYPVAILAPNNNTCPTKADIDSYFGPYDTCTDYISLSSNKCVPITLIYIPL